MLAEMLLKMRDGAADATVCASPKPPALLKRFHAPFDA